MSNLNSTGSLLDIKVFDFNRLMEEIKLSNKQYAEFLNNCEELLNYDLMELNIEEVLKFNKDEFTESIWLVMTHINKVYNITGKCILKK